MGNIKYHLNWDFLTFLGDEERDAYFLGLFYADGNNDNRSKSITIKLKGEDKEFLQRLSDSIYVTPRPLYEGSSEPHDVVMVPTTFATLIIGHKGISARMTQLGAHPRKTYTLKYPIFLSEKQERHFVRGYFDGDGCCAESKPANRQTTNRTIVICGNIEFLEGLKTSILKHTGLTFSIRKAVGIHQLMIGGNRQSLQFLEWLYVGSKWFLPRKFERYKKLTRDMQDLDDKQDYILFMPAKNRWRGRLPAKYGRKPTGVCKTYQEALEKRNEAIKFIETHSFEEWVSRSRAQWQKFDNKTILQARQYLAEGLSINAAAKRVGMSTTNLMRRLERENFKIGREK